MACQPCGEALEAAARKEGFVVVIDASADVEPPSSGDHGGPFRARLSKATKFHELCRSYPIPGVRARSIRWLLNTLSCYAASVLRSSARSLVFWPAAAAFACATTPAPAASADRAPSIVRLVPERLDRPSIVANIGEALVLGVVIDDADLDPLSVSVAGLPEGASFSPERRQLAWTPRPHQRGEHILVFRVSDGERESSRVLLVKVIPNRPPLLFQRSYDLMVGQYGRLPFIADDADGDELEYTLVNPPQRAHFDTSTGVLSWQPSETQIGTHWLLVEASDGSSKTRHRYQVVVSARSTDAWGAFFMPSLGGALYVPPARADAGTFVGGSFGISLVSWIHRTDDPGPSHGHIYLRGELYASTRQEVPVLFAYMAGFSLAIESNPTRRYLIPSYGLEMGGLIHETLGSPFQFTPYGGLCLYADHGVFVMARGGYRVVPVRVSRLSGVHAALEIEASVW